MEDTDSAAAVRWRALDAGLWAARRSGEHLGTVEGGRRWTACDAESRTLGAFRTFGEAQRAVIDGRVGPRPAGTAPGAVITVSLFICAVAGVLAAMRPLLGV